MRKSLAVMAAMAATVMGAQAAHADVTCEPGACVVTGTNTAAPNAYFDVTPSNVGPGYTGPINANIGNTLTGPSNVFTNFTDTFEFLLPQTGTGSGGVINLASVINGVGDINFTSILVNGVAGVVSNVGSLSSASAAGVLLAAGPNVITVSGQSKGTAAYGGNISFTPAVPEMATWGMMILGFIGMGAAMRRRRTTVTFGGQRAFA